MKWYWIVSVTVLIVLSALYRKVMNGKLIVWTTSDLANGILGLPAVKRIGDLTKDSDTDSSIRYKIEI